MITINSQNIALTAPDKTPLLSLLAQRVGLVGPQIGLR
jgi:aerobic-type carbon monoxide dehydrogenase small subunit (CoxS/CutS family)